MTQDEFIKLFGECPFAMARQGYKFADPEILKLTNNFGEARWTYNTSLQAIQDSWHSFNRNENWISCSRAITELKKDPDYYWLNDVSSDVIKQSLRNLQTVFDNFFKKRANHPKYKKKWAKQSCRFTFDKRHSGKVESWQNGNIKARGGWYKPMQ